jgi:hypothetical protein
MSLPACPPQGPASDEPAVAPERADASSSETGCAPFRESENAHQALGDAVFSLLGLPFDKLEQQLQELR